MVVSNISPAQYWGQKFINSASRKYVIISGYVENLDNINDSIVFFCDEKGKMLTTKGLRWSLFLVTYSPSMLKSDIFEVVD